MSYGFLVDPNAVYDDRALIVGMGMTEAAIEAARKSGRLRHAKIGRRVFFRGQWVLRWLESTARPTPTASQQRQHGTDFVGESGTVGGNTVHEPIGLNALSQGQQA